MPDKLNVKFFISHPIQYFSPLFKELSKNDRFNFHTIYFSDETLKVFVDKEFGKKVSWDTNLLDGYNYKFLKNNSLKPSIYNIPFGLINSGIKDEVKNTDIVIIHGWNYISHLLVFLFAIIYKKPILLRAEMPYKQELLKSKVKQLLKSFFLEPLFKRMSGFLSIGIENKKFFEYYGVNSNKIYFAPYAIDNDFFRAKYHSLKNSKFDLKNKHSLGKYKNCILFVGKLIDKKRPMDLLKAFHKADLKDSCLVFVGDGQKRLDLEQYIKEHSLTNIYLKGFKNQFELPEFYMIADIFVLPSGIGETWGLVVNEAMNYNLPILVSSTVGCSDDLVRDNGLTFKEGDIFELSTKIKKMILEKNLKYMGEVSSEIIKDYSFRNINKAIENAIKNIEN